MARKTLNPAVDRFMANPRLLPPAAIRELLANYENSEEESEYKHWEGQQEEYEEEER